MGIEYSFNKRILFIFIFPLFFQFEQPVMRLYMERDEKNKYFLFNIFKIFLSYVFSSIFLLIIKFRTKKKNQKIKPDGLDENEDLEDDAQKKICDPIKLEIYKNRTKKIKQNILFILILSIFDLTAYIVNFKFDNKLEFKFFLNSIGIFFEIIFYGLLSFFVLKQKYYAHHKVSFLIIFGCLIILFIVYIVQLLKSKRDFNRWVFPYYMLYTFLYSLYNVLGKKYLDTYYKSPYFMLAIIGLINSFCLLIYDIIVYNVDVEKSGVIIGFKDHITSIGCFFAFLLELIIKFIYTIGIWLTIYYLTPWHFIISDFISEMLKFYIRTIIMETTRERDDYHSDPVKIIVFTWVYIINFICSLIFNELIIIKHCNLYFYTQKYIKLRERIDTSLLIQNKNFDEESNASSEDYS